MTGNILLSAFVLVVGISAVFLAGIPATYYVTNRQDASLTGDPLLALSLFSGYCIITCILKVFVKFDVPVQYSAWPFLAATIILFFLFVKDLKKKNSLASICPSKKFLISMLIIILAAGFAYFIIGPRDYKGYAWWDVYFYGSQAEFLKTIPFSKLTELAGTRTWLGASWIDFQGAERVCRGVFQAYVAAITMMDGASTIGFLEASSGSVGRNESLIWQQGRDI